MTREDRFFQPLSAIHPEPPSLYVRNEEIKPRLQLDWSPFKDDVSGVRNPPRLRGRFAIVRNTEGYSAVDKSNGSIGRVTTLAAARAWCGIRCGETAVRHEPREDPSAE